MLASGVIETSVGSIYTPEGTWSTSARTPPSPACVGAFPESLPSSPIHRQKSLCDLVDHTYDCEGRILTHLHRVRQLAVGKCSLLGLLAALPAQH